MVEECEIVIMMKKIDKENKAIIGIGIVVNWRNGMWHFS